MTFFRRHPLSSATVAVAVIATAGVFLLARPQHVPRYESTMVDFSKVEHYSPRAIRSTFAAEGIELRVASRFGGFVTLSNTPGRLTADALQVIVAAGAAKGSFGPKLEPYDVRFGNVLVTYGGDDERLLGRIDAAVDELRSRPVG